MYTYNIYIYIYMYIYTFIYVYIYIYIYIHPVSITRLQVLLSCMNIYDYVDYYMLYIMFNCYVHTFYSIIAEASITASVIYLYIYIYIERERDEAI